MPAMASVDTMARSQQELLEAGRAKLAKFKERHNKNKNKNGRKPAIPDAKIYANGNPNVETSPQVSTNSHSDALKSTELAKDDVDRNGVIVEVDQPRRIHFEPDVRRNEENREQFVASDKLSARFEDEEEEKRKHQEIEELRRTEREAAEAMRKERELEEQRNQLALVRQRIEREADERKQKQREAEEAKRKEREDAEEARRQALNAEVAKRKEDEAKRKEREAEEIKRRQHYIAEAAKRKEREAEEIRRKEREAEEIRRKEREAEELKRRQRDEEEFRRKQREEFSSLEQHIQDLTEEKFALQRELAKARAMTEDFVSEHSALVENFNNQGQVVNQLKEDIEQLEARIKERDSFAMVLMLERDRAQQDFAAAREQSQTMAGEVIVLENRIRTLRSHELKMEKDMGALNSEVESHRKQAAAWDKDRSHLQTLIEALQEEKKVLQVRLRKVASGEREFMYRSETPEVVQLRQRVLADASTSTDDLPPSEPLNISSEGPSTPLESPSLDTWHHSRRFEESGQSTAESSHLRSTHESSSESPFMRSPFSDHGLVSIGSPQSGGKENIVLPVSTPMSIPGDVMRTIKNINDVIASLGEEKTAMVKALKAESKGAAELRALNADLSRKLAATTQQLELVVSQRMAEGSSTDGLATSRNASAALDYVDEGDEVVDRVFTWIMQLFPSRNSRRNGVKRL